MTFIVADRIKDVSTNTGSGPFQVSGVPSQGHRSFRAVCSVNDTFIYSIQHQTSNEFEVGYGTYSAANTVTRNIILTSSNNNNIVSFTSGTKDIFITMAANNIVYKDSNGKVGIGTISPNSLFEVAGQIYSSSSGFKFPDSTTQNTAGIITFNGRSGPSITPNTGDYSVAQITGLQITLDSKANIVSPNFTGTPSATAGYVIGSSRHYLYSISTNTVGLRINTAGPYLSFTGTGTNITLRNSSAGNISFNIGATYEAMKITSTGAVAIATDTATQALDVNGSITNRGGSSSTLGYATMRQGDSSYTGYIEFNSANSSRFGFVGYGHPSAGLLVWSENVSAPIVFGTNSTEKMRIDGSGNVGIGLTSSQSPLHVYGAGSSPNLSANTGITIFQLDSTLQLQMGGINSGSYPFWLQTKNSNNSGSVYPLLLNPLGGNIGIGTTTPTSLLDVNGTINFSALHSGTAAGLRFVTPQMYGAAGNGTTDDTSALSSALNSGYPVFLHGKFRITSKITITLSSSLRTLTIYGSGFQNAQIIVDFTTDNAFVVDYGSVQSPWGGVTNSVQLRDFTVVPNVASSYAAFRLNGTTATGSSEPTAHIMNMHVIPNSTSNYMSYALDFNNMRNVNVVDCVFNGSYGNHIGSAIRWGGGTNSAPVDLHIRDCQMWWWSKGVELTPSGQTSGANDWQGLYMSNSTLGGVDHGVYGTTSDNFSELIVINGCHINFKTNGIYLEGCASPFITNNYLLCGIGSATTAHGIYQINNNSVSAYGSICHNIIKKTATPTTCYAIRQVSNTSAMRTAVFANQNISCPDGFSLVTTNMTTSTSTTTSNTTV